MRLIRVWDCVSNAIASIILCKVCIITLLPHEGMSNLILWQAFSMFPIFYSLTCDSTSVTLDWFRWGRRAGWWEKGGIQRENKSTFRSLICSPHSSVWLQARDQKISWRKSHRQNSRGSDCIEQCLSAAATEQCCWGPRQEFASFFTGKSDMALLWRLGDMETMPAVQGACGSARGVKRAPHMEVTPFPRGKWETAVWLLLPGLGVTFKVTWTTVLQLYPPFHASC